MLTFIENCTRRRQFSRQNDDMSIKMLKRILGQMAKKAMMRPSIRLCFIGLYGCARWMVSNRSCTHILISVDMPSPFREASAFSSDIISSSRRNVTARSFRFNNSEDTFFPRIPGRISRAVRACLKVSSVHSGLSLSIRLIWIIYSVNSP